MMDSSPRDVIVIGGGLSGLAAAYELEQHNIRYTLIEVKPRLGGSLISVAQNGFIMDGGPFAFPPPASWPTLDHLGLTDDLIDVPAPPGKQLAAFARGAQSLTDALAASLTGTVIKRMAVTGIATEENGCRVCLENGLTLDARAVVVAASARYAERMLRTLAPTVSALLERYHYDHVTRVALGYTAANKPTTPPVSPPDIIFAALHTTDHPARVPAEGLLLQAAVRVPLDRADQARLVADVVETLDWPAPEVSYVRYWPDADPLTITGPSLDPDQLAEALPSNVALAGSCYRPLSLPGRTAAGRQAARRVLASL